MAARSPLAAARLGAAAFLGLVLPSLLGCAALAVYTAPGSDAEGEGVCAWFGDASEDVLYFGESAFWHELRRHVLLVAELAAAKDAAGVQAALQSAAAPVGGWRIKRQGPSSNKPRAK